MKHTPAPWKNTSSHYIDSASGYRIAEVYNHAPGYMDNARLISAAPELLEALKALVEQMETQKGDWLNTDEARAAIQKAEGK